jgi:hypothetical protein
LSISNSTVKNGSMIPGLAAGDFSSKDGRMFLQSPVHGHRSETHSARTFSYSGIPCDAYPIAVKQPTEMPRGIL